MSGLYNMALGDGREVQRGAAVLRMLGLTFEDTGRFRDAWVEKGENGPVIAIYTRNGGGNRNDYEEVIAAMQAHENYLRDADDEFDSTYATFYFTVPDEWCDSLAQVAIEPVDMSAKWRSAIDAMGGGR